MDINTRDSADTAAVEPVAVYGEVLELCASYDFLPSFSPVIASEGHYISAIVTPLEGTDVTAVPTAELCDP